MPDPRKSKPSESTGRKVLGPEPIGATAPGLHLLAVSGQGMAVWLLKGSAAAGDLCFGRTAREHLRSRKHGFFCGLARPGTINSRGQSKVSASR